jgi:uncharacterized protein DUF1801
MTMVKTPPQLVESLYRYDSAVQALGLGLRGLVLEELAPSHEYIFSMRSKVVLLYGSSDRVLADCVCSIAVFRQHVTLIFHRGVDLADTHGLLRGSGKALRHIRIEQEADLDRPVLKAYLREARALSDLKKLRPSATRLTTRFKSSVAAGRRKELPRLF